MTKGRIFDIQHFSTNDGPGIRTTVFLKGCPLHCQWCSNPESQSPAPQIMFHEHLCKACGSCLKVCPSGAITRQGTALAYDRKKCINCGACAKVCPYEARILSGREVTVAELEPLLREDWRYYMETGGGITCSGGESLAQPEFLHELFSRIHDGLGYNTCLDTTAFAPWETIAYLLPVTDLILLDIKHMNSAEHERMTGVPNERILDNARHLSQVGANVIIRVPLIPGFNDTSWNIAELASFLRELSFSKVEIMPYHTLGLSKYAALGRVYKTIQGKPDVQGMVKGLQGKGLDVLVHSLT